MKHYTYLDHPLLEYMVHYTEGATGEEKAWVHGFLFCNVVKYLIRAGRKCSCTPEVDGCRRCSVGDYKKAHHYLRSLISSGIEATGCPYALEQWVELNNLDDEIILSLVCNDYAKALHMIANRVGERKEG